MTAYGPRHAFDVAPRESRPSLLTPVATFFRRAIAAVRRRLPAPAARPAGTGTVLPSHPATDPAGHPVLRDRMLSEVREQWNAWHDDVPATGFKPSAAMDTGEFAVLDAKVDAVLPRPVNGRNLGTQPRRQPVYGERPQLEVERDMALAAGERARGRYQPATPALLRQVLNGLQRMDVTG